MIGSTNSIWNVNRKYEQLVNYTMLYDSGDECTDITGGWGVLNISKDYSPTMNISKNTDNIYTTQKGSGSSGPFTMNEIDFSNYSGEGIVCKYNVNSTSWNSVLMYGIDVRGTNFTKSSSAKLAVCTEITTKKLLKSTLDKTNLSKGYFGYVIWYDGNLTMYNSFLYKQDNWQELCTIAGLTSSNYTDEATLCADSTAITTILGNEEAVNYMIYSCTGSFMAEFVASETCLSALNNSPYKTIIMANEHWAKFLAMVA